MGRKYTGWDGNASGRRAGTEKFVQLLSARFGNGVWNNGTWNVRNMRGSEKPSVHGTGRAADVSWRKNGDKGFGDYEKAKAVLEFLVAYAEPLLIEELHDYYLMPHGRGWRCDRAAWKIYDKPSIGTPGGDWWHIEIAPTYADDPGYYDRVFREIADGTIKPGAVAPAPAPTPKPAPAPAPAPGVLKFEYPDKALKVGSAGEAVKLVQAVVGVTPDGKFGPATKAAVVKWQTSNPTAGPADGIVGKQTWSVMFPA